MLKVYNSLSRKKEIFKPIKKGKASMYSCGPTVYNFAHIGNLRTYILNDIVKRALMHNKIRVIHGMNLTDVDDKTIKASQKENISLKELTAKYEKEFFEDTKKLNIIKPEYVLRATESIPEMVALITTLLKKKYAYKAEDGIYFSVQKAKDYGKLIELKKIKKTKARIKSDEYDKEHICDFALWKFYSKEDGLVFWETEIGKGRPGWHIECSAMSMKLFGNSFDIHTGGQDLIFPHHSNEIAQSESATGKKLANYWIHGALLAMKESKMSKSLGNILTLKNLEEQEYKPMHFRYLCLLTHYRKPLHFSFESLDAAKNAFERVKRKVIELKRIKTRGKDKSKEIEKIFHEAINNDLNMPKAIQIFLHALDDDSFDSKKKVKLLEHFDSVLGLDIKGMHEEKISIPTEIQKLLNARETARKNEMWAEADILRERIREKGYKIEDIEGGPKVESI